MNPKIHITEVYKNFHSTPLTRIIPAWWTMTLAFLILFLFVKDSQTAVGRK